MLLREAQALQSYTNRLLLAMSAAMACPSGRVGEQLERHVDKHRFPMRIRPGDRPPGAEVRKSPLNVELLQALEGRSGNWAALRPFEGGLIAHPRPRYTTAVRALDACPARALVR